MLPNQQPLDSEYQPPAFEPGLQKTGSVPVSPEVSQLVEVKLYAAIPVVMEAPHPKMIGGDGGGGDGGGGDGGGDGCTVLMVGLTIRPEMGGPVSGGHWENS